MTHHRGDGALSAETGAPTPLRARMMDLVFLVGVFFKGVDGLFEVFGGLVVLLLPHPQLLRTAHAITAKELGEDPDDLIANLIVHGAAHLHAQSATFLGLYLLLHGVVKLGIVLALILGSSRVYPWAIAALLIFLVYQVYEIVVVPSPLVIILTVLDAAIVVLTWREWRNHRTLRDSMRATQDWILHRA